MSRRDDDHDEMGGMDEAALTQFLVDLRAMGDGPAPAPAPELAAMFDGVPVLAARRRSPYRGRRLLAVAVAGAAASAVGVAAAHNTLPQPAQRIVSRVVNLLTPLHIDPSRPPVVPAPGPTDTPHPPAITAPPSEGDGPGGEGPGETAGGEPGERTGSSGEDGSGSGSGGGSGGGLEGGSDGGSRSGSDGGSGSDSGSGSGSGGGRSAEGGDGSASPTASPTRVRTPIGGDGSLAPTGDSAPAPSGGDSGGGDG